MSDTAICPWCQSEIVWDQKSGPESFCPHCDNELSNYRSFHIVETGNEMDLQPQGQEQLSMIEAAIEDASLEDDFAAYEEQVGKYVEQQDERVDCESCGEGMICAGTHTVNKGNLVPSMPRTPGLPPLLSPPFNLDFYICPACFRMTSILSEEDRMALIASLRNNK